MNFLIYKIGRINIFESSIIDIELKDMVSILPPNCLFKPEKSSKILLVILEKLMNLPTEEWYLLSHKAGDHNVVVWNSQDKEKSTDLSRYYDLIEAHKKYDENSLKILFRLIY